MLFASNVLRDQYVGVDLKTAGQLFLLRVDQSETLLIEIFDAKGSIILLTDKPLPDRMEKANDLEAALAGEIGVWRGQNYVTSERVLSVTVPIYHRSLVIGAMRYTISLESTYSTINTFLFYGLIVCVMLLLATPGVFSPLLKRFLAPLVALNSTTEQLIKAEHSSRLIPPAEAEFAEVAGLYNSMFDQIECSERMQNEFISSISHELRTPLTAIRGWGETLTAGELNDKDELRLGLEIICKEAARMTGLVEDLLDFSHLQAGRIHLNLGKVRINHLVGEIHDLLSIKAAKKAVALAMELGGGLPIIEGDGNRLKQVLLNLLDNSLKFTPVGGSITVSTHRTTDSVIIAVADTGSGIDAKDLPKILGKFVKGDGRSPGSGLGLSIANEIVTLHGGQLSLASEPGEGTIATVVLPITRVDDETSLLD